MVFYFPLLFDGRAGSVHALFDLIPVNGRVVIDIESVQDIARDVLILQRFPGISSPAFRRGNPYAVTEFSGGAGFIFKCPA